MNSSITRRVFALSLPVAVGGCIATSSTTVSRGPAAPTTPVAAAPLSPPPPLPPEAKLDYAPDPSDTATYAAITTEPFPVPAIDLKRINPAFLRRTVSYMSGEAPGSIIIDPGKRYLYYILGGGRAVRYGVGVGREGFGWNGEAYIRSKQEWPKWFPPPEMRQRQPELAKFAPPNGMSGGPGNPLGARAMYLWQGNQDTYYRMHGTVEPWTIGSRVSSGCIRLINQDAMDLYNRAAINAKVTVLPG
ncbi:MAG: L,D-transpeptidase [Hyphomicrobiales bacterium]